MGKVFIVGSSHCREGVIVGSSHCRKVVVVGRPCSEVAIVGELSLKEGRYCKQVVIVGK